MSKRAGWVNITGVVLGVVVIGVTAFSAISALGRGPAGVRWLPRTAGTIAEEVGKGVRSGLGIFGGAAGRVAAGWQSAEGEEIVRGAQTSLSVDNVSGRIRVTGWDEDTVRVRYVKEARTEADLKDFVIEIQTEGVAISVRPVYEPLGGAGRFGSVEFEIALPRRIEHLALHNVSGEIVVQDLPGAVDKELTTVSGSIATAGPGDLSAKTTSGSVEFDFSGDALQASSVSGRLSGSLRSLGRRGADLGTVSGSVEIRAFEGLDAALDLRSLSGSIDCAFKVDVREQSRNRLTGTVGKGSVPLAVRTTSGSIRIDKE